LRLLSFAALLLAVVGRCCASTTSSFASIASAIESRNVGQEETKRHLKNEFPGLELQLAVETRALEMHHITLPGRPEAVLACEFLCHGSGGTPCLFVREGMTPADEDLGHADAISGAVTSKYDYRSGWHDVYSTAVTGSAGKAVAGYRLPRTCRAPAVG
jgi:hypothetical protein